MLNIATYFVFYPPNDTGSDGGFRTFTILWFFPRSVYLGELGGKCMKRLEPHFHAWRNVASLVLSGFVYKIVSDASACIDNE